MWTITKDHYAEETAKPGTNANAVGLVGPRTANLTHAQIVSGNLGQKFRMLDDDRNVVYEGVYLDDGDEDGGFQPLDNFGTPNFGCTIIQYWNKGWQDL